MKRFASISKFLLIFAVITAWIYSGWPQVWHNPPFPPKIQEAMAAVANDAASESHTGTTGNTSAASFTWTHTPAGTPRGVLVFVYTISATKKVTGVTYGGVAMTEVSGGAAVDTATEPGRVDTFFLGTSIPTGARSVIVSRTNDTTIMYATAQTQTAGANTEVTGIILLQENQALAEQSVNDGSTGVNSVRYAGAYSGLAAPPTVGANSTLLNNIDLGAYGVSTVRETTAGQGARLVGFTAATDDVAAVHLAVREVVVAPTVTTQAASAVEATTATGNGNITATGGQNATAWGVCYKISTGCTTADSVAAGSGTGGTGAFTASMTSLSPGTMYYIKAYATNSAGTSYGSEVTTTTKPAAPTGALATDGTYTDKVTITWTKSTGATNYNVWRDAVDLGAAGDVATFDDTGATASTITAGSAVASDGTNSSYVALSLSGASANNGTTHTYKVVASNATGNSADSATDTGYRGVGSLTYQWQRSAADSDASYSDIVGATTASYNDTGAPADGSGRYFKVVENATGATQQISTADRGYRAVAVVSVSVSDGVVTYGTMVAGTSKTTVNLSDTQTLTNDGNVTEIFNIKGQNAACPWTLAATTGTDQYVHEFCKATDVSCASPPTNYTALTISYQTLYTGVAASATRQLDLRVTVPTVSSCFTSQAIDVTIQATQ